MQITSKLIPWRRKRKQFDSQHLWSALAGAAAGTAAAYWLDPDSGPERRARVRDGAQRSSRVLRDAPRTLTQRIRRTADAAAESAERTAERRAEEGMLGLGGNWSPIARLLAGATGAGLLNRCLARPSVQSAAAGALGLALLARSASASPLAQLRAAARAGTGGSARAATPAGTSEEVESWRDSVP